MNIHEKVSTGLTGFDQVIDYLRLGDNVVWQVDAVSDYRMMADPFVNQAIEDGRKVIYVRFGSEPPVLEEYDEIKVFPVMAQSGFESFAMAVNHLVEQEGKRTFYIFDCLSDLLQYWHSDLMIENFFKVICPLLHELECVAYFAIIRNVHTNSTISRIRETTQLLLDLYHVNYNYYIHPLKVWKRYSSTMYFPHLIREQEAVSITASTEAAMLFSRMRRGEQRLDYWDVLLNSAEEALVLEPRKREATKRLLMSILIGDESKLFNLCNRYFTLADLLMIASRVVGTGFIGGKSVGMLLARKILEHDGKDTFVPYMEPHDSFFIGSDVFYTYIVHNGCWKLRTKQRTKEGYYRYAPELKEKLLMGKFPEHIREKFIQVLEYFGQSPIIVRSSSLLEDNYGNAFAGKYDSVFCVNQGTPEERLEAFEQAIRTVYASTMNEDALTYRMQRGLAEKDEQMAILVQRVSGDFYNELFFPHIAGVGFSSNDYVWDKSIDMNAGMLRLVFGLGTRAVERTVGDYVRIVALDQPERLPPVHFQDQKKFSQHDADVLSLRENQLISISLDQLFRLNIKVDKSLFATVDQATLDFLRERGMANPYTPYILDFQQLLTQTEFPKLMREMLAHLAKVYQYPVDIEFTANFTKDGRFRVNLLQCRPLQTRGLGKAVRMPEVNDGATCFFASEGNFMGGNVHLPIDYVVLVRTKPYLERNEQGKYAVARQIGKINAKLKNKNVMLVGPGRWGTTTPSLGVPVHFSEICNMSVICEVASSKQGMMPELSYGSHFFLDLVESGIFYAAIFAEDENVVYHPEVVLKKKNLLTSISPGSESFADVIHVAAADGMEIFSDTAKQKLICIAR